MDQTLNPTQLTHLANRFSIPNFNWIQYKDILHHGLPQGDFVLFYPQEQYGNTISGHYTCVIQTPNVIYFYDPYGELPDTHKVNLSGAQKQILYDRKLNHQNLTKLLWQTGKLVDYSHYPHQQYSDDIATCGRHCVLRLANR